MQEATRGESKPFVVGPNDGEATWFLGTRIVIKATAQSTGGIFGLLESQLAADFSPPLHIHHQGDESFWMLERAAEAHRLVESSDVLGKIILDPGVTAGAAPGLASKQLVEASRVAYLGPRG